MLTFLDIYNPETVWPDRSTPSQLTATRKVGRLRKIGGQLLIMGEGWRFLIRSSVAALAFWLRGYHTDSKACWFFRFLSQKLGRGPFSFQPAQRAFGTKALPQHNIVREIPQSIWKQRKRFPSLGCVSWFLHCFRYIFSSDHPLVVHAFFSTPLRLSLCIYIYICQ